MKKEYAQDRLNKPELIFRYQVRAALVVWAIKKYLLINSKLNILEFGASEGLTMLEINNSFPNNQLTGIEYSEELLQYAPSNLPNNINLIQGDVTNLKNTFPDNSQDVVIALALLEHLPDPSLAVKEAYRILKPGGLFIASSPSPFWDHISTKLGLLEDEQHMVDMTKKLMIQLTKKSNFNLITFLRFMFAPVSFLPYLKIPIPPKTSLKVDRLINNIHLFDWLFVNQAIIAKK